MKIACFANIVRARKSDGIKQRQFVEEEDKQKSNFSETSAASDHTELDTNIAHNFFAVSDTDPEEN